MIKRIFSLLLFVCLASAALAQDGNRQMYRWTDENGVVHFTDQRPANQDVTVIDIPASASQPVSSPPPVENPEAVPQDGGEQLSPADQTREAMAKRREEILAARAKNEQICDQMRDEVAELEPNRHVYYTDDQGEEVRMDDVERTNRVAVAKAYIADNCQ